MTTVAARALSLICHGFRHRRQDFMMPRTDTRSNKSGSVEKHCLFRLSFTKPATKHCAQRQSWQHEPNSLDEQTPKALPFFRLGTPGKPWGDSERATLARRSSTSVATKPKWSA